MPISKLSKYLFLKGVLALWLGCLVEQTLDRIDGGLSGKLQMNERDVNGIGIDTLSVDCGTSKDFMVHHIAPGAGKYHLENVANLGKPPLSGLTLIVAQTKIEDGTGGRARISAILPGLFSFFDLQKRLVKLGLPG